MNAPFYNRALRWSDEMDDKLKALVADGATFSESASAIGLAFGVAITRNACIGRAHRLGIKGNRSQGVTVTQRPRTEKRSHKKKEFSFKPVVKPTFDFRKLNTISLAPKKIGHDGVDLPPATPGPNAVSFMDASHCHCRWPYGDPRDLETFRYCGEVALASSYCPGHQRQSRDVRPDKKRRPFKD